MRVILPLSPVHSRGHVTVNVATHAYGVGCYISLYICTLDFQGAFTRMPIEQRQPCGCFEIHPHMRGEASIAAAEFYEVTQSLCCRLGSWDLECSEIPLGTLMWTGTFTHNIQISQLETNNKITKLKRKKV